MKFKAIFTVFVLFLIAGLFFAFNGTGKSKFDAGYILTTGGDKNDTVATTSANDTSDTFVNEARYDVLYAEYVQNSTRTIVKLDYPVIENVRMRYVTADSTQIFERQTDLGWMRIPLIPIGAQTTTVSSVTVGLKTGSNIFQIRGIKE